MRRPKEIVAHRGASAEAPENTLEAVEAAWKAGADAVEIDVRLTADGKLAVIHELKALDVGSWKGARWKGCKIPALEEVLAAISELVRVIEASGKAPEEIVLIGFDNSPRAQGFLIGG